MREIFSLLHDRHAVRGVTVFRGIAGFGADGEVHADDMLRLNIDLPLVIEFFDEPPAAEAAIHLLETMVAQGTHRILASEMQRRRRRASELAKLGAWPPG